MSDKFGSPPPRKNGINKPWSHLTSCLPHGGHATTLTNITVICDSPVRTITPLQTCQKRVSLTRATWSRPNPHSTHATHLNGSRQRSTRTRGMSLNTSICQLNLTTEVIGENLHEYFRCKRQFVCFVYSAGVHQEVCSHKG